MDTILIIVLIIIAAIILFFQIKSREPQKEEKPDKAFDLLLAQMHELSRVVDTKMGETTKQVSESMRTQFSESAKRVWTSAMNSRTRAVKPFGSSTG